jgi:hypothetical protein
MWGGISKVSGEIKMIITFYGKTLSKVTTCKTINTTWDNNVETDLTEVGCNSVDCIIIRLVVASSKPFLTLQ